MQQLEDLYLDWIAHRRREWSRLRFITGGRALALVILMTAAVFSLVQYGAWHYAAGLGVGAAAAAATLGYASLVKFRVAYSPPEFEHKLPDEFFRAVESSRELDQMLKRGALRSYPLLAAEVSEEVAVSTEHQRDFITAILDEESGRHLPSGWLLDSRRLASLTVRVRTLRFLNTIGLPITHEAAMNASARRFARRVENLASTMMRREEQRSRPAEASSDV
jgi:hypothetical protein